MSDVKMKDDWVMRSFMVPANEVQKEIVDDMYYSTAYVQAVDTRPGGHWAINPPPQFTLGADLPISGLGLSDRGRHSVSGMGRKYHEAINENMQLLNMRFGFPEYNGMASFFLTMGDAQADFMARTGRFPGVMWHAGRAIGTVIGLRVAAPFMLAGYAYRLLKGQSPGKYYYLKPAMHMYWMRVNQILNAIAVELKIVKPFYQFNRDIPGVTKEDHESLGLPGQTTGPFNAYSDDDRAMMYEFMPDIFRKDGTIDVFSLSTRVQRVYNKQHKALVELMEHHTDIRSAIEAIREYRYTMIDYDDSDTPIKSFEDAMDEWVSSPGGMWDEDSSMDPTWVESDTRPTINIKGIQGDGTASGVEEKEGYIGSMWADFKGKLNRLVGAGGAALMDGGEFVTFAVQRLDAYQETFTNQTGESAIKGSLDGATAAGRKARFSLSGGNTGIGIVDSVISGAVDMMAGGLQAVGLDSVWNLFTGSYVDIPHEWKNSSSQIHTPTYRMELRSWSGDSMSRLINLYIPLAHILAAALPISSGRATYTSPFLCEYYHTGHAQSRLGIISNLSITTAVGNVGLTKRNEPLGFDVTFTVQPLSPVVHTPISTHDGISPLSGLLKDPDEFDDLIARITARGFIDQVYMSRKATINFTRKLTQIRNWASVERSMSFMREWKVAELTSNFFPSGGRWD